MQSVCVQERSQSEVEHFSTRNSNVAETKSTKIDIVRDVGQCLRYTSSNSIKSGVITERILMRFAQVEGKSEFNTEDNGIKAARTEVSKSPPSSMPLRTLPRRSSEFWNVPRLV